MKLKDAFKGIRRNHMSLIRYGTYMLKFGLRMMKLNRIRLQYVYFNGEPALHIHDREKLSLEMKTESILEF